MKHSSRHRRSPNWGFITKITIIYLGIFSSPFIISQFSPKEKTAKQSYEASQEELANRTTAISAQSLVSHEGKECDE